MSEFPEMFKLLAGKIDNITTELIDVKTSINEIKDNTEISVMNGGNFEVTMKTNVLLKHLYEQTKQGGGIDKKFEECKNAHTMQSKFKLFNKEAGTFVQTLKIISFVVLFIMVILTFFKSKDADEKATTTNSRIDKIEKLSK
jgi:hypothetical protein